MRPITALCLAFALLSLSAAPAPAAKQVLRIAVAEGKGQQTAAQSFAPFFKQMNASPNYSFQMVVFEDSEKQYEALKDGKVELAFLGPATYVKAHYEFKAQPLVAEAGDLRSMIVVKKSSPITKVEQLRGKDIALGYEGSTTTHLLPMLLFSKHYLKKEDLGKLMFIGDQTKKILDAVLDGTAAAGGVSENLYAAHKNELRVLETSEALPGAAIVASPKVSAKTAQELRALFVKYVPSPTAQRFTKGAVAVTDEKYNRVRFLCKVVLGHMYL
jgi:phosphonate transport system substrate-binding protein